VFLQTVLVESETDARKTIQFLNENNLGRIAVLVLSGSKFKVQSSKSKSANDIANFIGVSDNFAQVLSKTLTREMTAQLVENFERVNAKDDEVYVNFNGDLLVGGKLFIAGQAGSNEKNKSLLAFKRELRELENETRKLNVAVEKSEKETSEARAVLADKENKLVDLQSFIVKIERELLSVEIQAKTSAQETERAERHLKVVGEEAKQIEAELAEIESRQKEARLNSAKADTSRSRASENLAEISKELNEARIKVTAENTVLNEKRTLAATSGERVVLPKTL
jgi:chromosome segregation ATPase